jgi:hypothetical protein
MSLCLQCNREALLKEFNSIFLKNVIIAGGLSDKNHYVKHTLLSMVLIFLTMALLPLLFLPLIPYLEFKLAHDQEKWS